MWTINGREVVVLGDKTTHGGEVVTACSGMLYNGIPVARVGDEVSCPKCSGTHKIVTGSPIHSINGKQTARNLDSVSCGALLISRNGDAANVDEGEYAMKNLAEFLGASLTYKDKILLCIPDIADAMATRTDKSVEAQGWLYLRRMMIKWLTTPVNRNAKTDDNPFWVDWNWVIELPGAPASPFGEDPVFEPYPSVKEEYTAFTSRTPMDSKQNIYDTAALNQLGKILKRNNAFGSERIYFDYIRESANESVPPGTIRKSWKDLEDRYFTLRKVPQTWEVDARQAVFGSFTLRALAGGYTEPNGNGKGHIVHITECAVFAHDIYGFANDGWQILGFWDCDKKEVTNTKGWPAHLLENRNFRDYQDRHGLGGDYLVLSQPGIVEGFTGMEYEYE